jgi:hypothetical protein
MKTRKITLHKDEVLYDIEGLAYKFTEGTALEGKAKNAVSADHNETLDDRLLRRMMDTRDARIRKRLTFALAPISQEESNNIPETSDSFVYNLSFNDKFDDNMLNVLKEDMHEYIVKGVLLDWFKRLGIQTIAVDALEVQEHEEAVVALVRTPSYMKAPMQPWGPR